MSRFNTGNPLGSGDPRDLDDNAKNMDLAVNSDGDTFQDRMGKSRLTWTGIVKAGSGDPAIAVDAAARAEAAASSVEQSAEQIATDAAQQAASAVIAGVDGQVAVAQSAADRAEAASNAAFINADVYPDVASGIAAVGDGEQFQVVEGDEIVRYRRDTASTQTPMARYPSALLVRHVSYYYGLASIPLSNGFIDASGAFTGSAGWRVTDFLPVVGGAVYAVATQTNSSAYHAWYDEDKGFISTFRDISFSVARAEFTAPGNARFVRVSTQLPAVADSYIRDTDGGYNIEQLNKALAAHAVGIPSSGVIYSGGNVESALDAIIQNQLVIRQTQTNILNKLDTQSDRDSPYFIPAWAVTKRHGGGSQDVYSIASRGGERTFEMDSDPGVSLRAIVVKDDVSGKHIPMVVQSQSGTTVTVSQDLPASISQFMQMHDAVDGQHLTRFGYYALAEFMVDSVQKYSYKKRENLLFEYHPPACSTSGYNNSDILSKDLSEVVAAVTRLPGTGVGGTLSNGQIRRCSTSENDLGISTSPTDYLARRYDVVQEIAGAGMQFSVDLGRKDGFLEIWFYAKKDANFNGNGRIEIVGSDSAVLLDEAIEAGSWLQVRYVEFSGIESITVRLSLTDSVPTALSLCGVYAYSKAPETSLDGLFSSGDVIAFLGDSWTEFYGESLQERTKEYLADQGVTVTTLPLGRGSQTSAWGLYWVDRVISASPKPTHCVVLFGINDRNSYGLYESDTPSVYDFSPTDPNVNIPFNEGGVKGSVSAELWESNIQRICGRLAGAGIKPIVMMPAHTSSAAQSQDIRLSQLGRIAAGI